MSNHQAQKVMKVFSTLLGDLRDRWQDEKSYESFDKYQEVMKNVVATKLPSVTFVSLTQRPFILTCSDRNFRYQLKATSSQVSCAVYVLR